MMNTSILLVSLAATLTIALPSQQSSRTDEDTSMPAQLSRQSAFWVIATIALIAMIYLPHRVLGCPEGLTVYIKSSPFACLLDLVRALYKLLTSISFSSDQWEFRWTIFELYTERFGTMRAKEIERSRIRIILLVFGAVQAAKLYSCRGIPALQFLASCYLSSVCFDEVLLFYGKNSGYYEPSGKEKNRIDRPDSVVSDDTISTGTTNFFFFSVGALNLVWISFMAIGAFNDTSNTQRTKFMIGLVLIWLIGVGVLGWRFTHDHYGQFERDMTILISVLTAVTVWSDVWKHLSALHAEWPAWILYISGYLIGWLNEAVGSLPLVSLLAACFDSPRHKPPVISHVILTAVSIIVYVFWRYDVEQSSCPNWVGNLVI